MGRVRNRGGRSGRGWTVSRPIPEVSEMRGVCRAWLAADLAPVAALTSRQRVQLTRGTSLAQWIGTTDS